MPESPLPDEPARTVHASSIEGLESAWRGWRPGERTPCWYDFLPGPGEACGPDRVFHLVQLDIEFRARAGLPGLAEVRHFLHPRLDEPDAQLDDARQVELIRWEYQQRWKAGARPRREDYQRAFPRHAAALADLRPRWACPGCRRPATADDESAPTWRCPRCDREFAPTEVFPPRTSRAGDEALASPGQVATVHGEPLPPLPRRNTGDLSLAGLDPREYELLEQLGAGGMGEVHRGRDPGLGRDLAVKVMRPALRGHREAEGRFLREARVTGALQHPGIVPVHNVGRLPDGRLFFTMKLVRGHTLESLLAGGVAGRSDELLGHFEKVCQAVAYAHSRRVIHRDLKPANVMVGRFGEVQVMDWGLAKVLSARPPGPTAVSEEAVRESEAGEGETIIASASNAQDGQTVVSAEGPAELSRAGGAMGTPAFMPPEQAGGRLELIDERADVFSLGAILCVILTGRPPYQASSWPEVLDQARRGDLAEAIQRLADSGADAELVALGRDCLSAQPQDRPRDAGVVAGRVEAYRAGVQERLRRAELERAQARVRELERRKRRRLAAALAAAVLLLAGGAAAGLWWRQQRQARTDQTVTEALAEARLLRQQAQANPSEPGRLREALAAARRASDLAGTGASRRLNDEADDLLARVEEDEQAAGKDRRLQTALLEVRGPREGPKYDLGRDGRVVARAEPTADEQFAAAFRAWGLDVDATPTTDAAERLRGRPATVVAEVVAALDEWAAERRRQGKPDRKLADLATTLEGRQARRGELREILSRDRLPLERALSILSAGLRPVPIPFPVPLGDSDRLGRLAAEVDPVTEPPLGLLTLAQALRRAGDDARAERILRAAVQARPREVVLYQALGRLLAEQRPHRWREAAECYLAARALRPELGLSLAEALVQGGRPIDGMALFARLAAERPDNPFVHYRRGETLSDRRNHPEAAVAYRRAVELDPGDTKAQIGLGRALTELRKYDEAITTYNKALEIDPRLAIAHNNLGDVLARKGDPEGAIRQYEKAIEVDPRLGIAHHNLGTAVHQKGDVERAVRCYRRAVDLDPSLFRAYYNLARGLHGRGDRDGAIRLYRLVLELAPWFPGPYYYLGEAYREKGDLAEALRAHRKVVELHPNNPAPHYFLGNTLRTAGDVEGAIRCFRQAVDLDPEFALGYTSLGRTLLDAGRPGEAQAVLRRGADRVPSGDSERAAVVELLQECQRWVETEGRLTAYLDGKGVPADTASRLRMAQMAQGDSRKLYGAAAQLYRETFAADARVADDLRAGHRYNAACAAALAGCGRGKDADRLDPRARAGWREQASRWLRTDLEARVRQLNTTEAARARQALHHWRRDPDLAGVRDAEGLSRLPAEERAAWVKFWIDVEASRGRR